MELDPLSTGLTLVLLGLVIKNTKDITKICMRLKHGNS